MNRISKTALLLSFSLLCLTGCSSPAAKEVQDQTLIQYEEVVNADATTLKEGRREYVPFSRADASQVGKKIGTIALSGQDQPQSVHELKGQPRDQWIVTTGEDGKNAMIYREMDVTDYPDGFVSEYPWN